MSHGRFQNPISAALAAVPDFFRRQELADRLSDRDRLDGKTCLVTGANRGLGFAIAAELARRGGRVIMACRSQLPAAADRLRRLSGSARIDTVHVDLAEPDSIHAMCEQLQQQGVSLDVTVLNAGVTPPRSRPTTQGQDLMFAVNYLANFILVNRLLSTGVIPGKGAGGTGDGPIPRIIFISSDSHQGASAIDWQEFGHYSPYGVRKAINNYSYFKLLLNTLACELSRRVNPGPGTDVAVNVICPGPVNTDIIREAPLLLRLALRAIFTLFFQAPAKAARPVAYLAASAELADTTMLYLHMFNRKAMDPKVYDEAAGAKLWAESSRVWGKIDPRASRYGFV